MKSLEVCKIAKSITDTNISKKVYDEIKKILNQAEKIEVNFKEVLALTTFCAKDIFGRLYLELDAQKFHDKINITNVSDDFKIIIQEGIVDAMENGIEEN